MKNCCRPGHPWPCGVRKWGALVYSSSSLSTMPGAPPSVQRASSVNSHLTTSVARQGKLRSYQNKCCIWVPSLRKLGSKSGLLRPSRNFPACFRQRGDPSLSAPVSSRSPSNCSASGLTQLGSYFPFMIVKEQKERLSFTITSSKLRKPGPSDRSYLYKRKIFEVCGEVVISFMLITGNV